MQRPCRCLDLRPSPAPPVRIIASSGSPLRLWAFLRRSQGHRARAFFRGDKSPSRVRLAGISRNGGIVFRQSYAASFRLVLLWMQYSAKCSIARNLDQGSSGQESSSVSVQDQFFVEDKGRIFATGAAAPFLPHTSPERGDARCVEG